MNRSSASWLFALAVTLVVALFQNVTGPTHPVHGITTLGGSTFPWALARSHAGAGDHKVRIPIHSTEIQGTLDWRPAAGGKWHAIPMRQQGADLVASIPHASSDVAYRVRLIHVGHEIVLPEHDAVTLSFRGAVPAWALIAHVLAMLAALLFSTRAGLETMSAAPRYGAFLTTTLALMLAGVALGCVVSSFAFSRPWIGFPVGDDITANKTLLALILWLAAAAALRLGRPPQPWVLGASAVTLLADLIPHGLSMPQ